MLITLGQLGGIGIGWDQDVVRLSHFDINQTITLDVQDQTLGEVLQEIIKPLGLTALVQETGQIILRPSLDLVSSKLPPDWDISDLCKDDASIPKWRLLLQQMFPWLSESMEINDKAISWSNEVSVIDQSYVAIFLDQVRLSSGLNPKSKFEDEFLQPIPAVSHSVDLLSKPGGRVMKEGLSVAHILDLASNDVGLDLMIDWQMCNGHGMSHAASGVSLTRSRTCLKLLVSISINLR